MKCSLASKDIHNIFLLPKPIFRRGCSFSDIGCIKDNGSATSIHTMQNKKEIHLSSSTSAQFPITSTFQIVDDARETPSCHDPQPEKDLLRH